MNILAFIDGEMVVIGTLNEEAQRAGFHAWLERSPYTCAAIEPVTLPQKELEKTND